MIYVYHLFPPISLKCEKNVYNIIASIAITKAFSLTGLMVSH